MVLAAVGANMEGLVIGEPGIGAERSKLLPVTFGTLPELLHIDDVRLLGLLDNFLTYCAVSNTLLFDFL